MVSVHPPLLRGAIVQLVEDLGIVLPNIVAFQYNPAKITRNLKPWNPFDVDATKRAATATQAAPFDPEETYQFTLEFDATDDIDLGTGSPVANPVAIATGVAARLAALQKLVMPTQGMFGDLIGAASALAGKGNPAMTEVRKVPLSLFILGTGIILPVRVQALTIDMVEFNTFLYPHMATAQIELRVLTPEAFKCKGSVASDLAVAAYQFTRLQEDALAILNIASVATDAVGTIVGL